MSIKSYNSHQLLRVHFKHTVRWWCRQEATFAGSSKLQLQQLLINPKTASVAGWSLRSILLEISQEKKTGFFNKSLGKCKLAVPQSMPDQQVMSMRQREVKIFSPLTTSDLVTKQILATHLWLCHVLTFEDLIYKTNISYTVLISRQFAQVNPQTSMCI